MISNLEFKSNLTHFLLFSAVPLTPLPQRGSEEYPTISCKYKTILFQELNLMLFPLFSAIPPPQAAPTPAVASIPPAAPPLAPVVVPMPGKKIYYIK